MKDYLMNILWSLIPAAFFWGILALSMHKDRSRYRNCTFLLFAMLSLIPVIAALCGGAGIYVTSALAVLFILAMLVLPFLLIYNGFVMIRREGKRLQNLLSLLLGLFLLAGEASIAVFIILPWIADGAVVALLPQLPIVLVIIAISSVYVSICFLSFMLYTLFLQILPRRKDFDYCVILGAGLINGDQISKLLSQRIDKAIEIWHKDPTAPILIPSGGQGGNETVAEGRAMADYLRKHGIPDDHILIEDRSRTTNENLNFSRALITTSITTTDPMNVRQKEPYVAIVTSNYHVYRALRYARNSGFKATGIGAPVAAYYWPSALIREFIAIHAEKKHAILFGIGWLICLLPCFIS